MKKTLLALTLCSSVFTVPAFAQWPEKPITIIVP